MIARNGTSVSVVSTFRRTQHERLTHRTPMFRHLLQSRVSRAMTVVLVGGQVLTAIPVAAAPAPPATAPVIVVPQGK